MQCNLHFTKNVLDGPMAGAQVRTTTKCDDATEAVIWMQQLADGVHHDLILRGGYTAHNFSFETELAHDLAECIDGECQFCKEAAADFAYDLRGDH